MLAPLPVCDICGKDFINVCIPCASKRLYERLDNTVNRQNGCKSCGGFWKDCPICAKSAIRVDSVVDMRPGTKLKLFRITIPGQKVTFDVSCSNARNPMVNEISGNYLPGREIIVLSTGKSRIYDQLLEELGCMEGEVDMTVNEITGPFEHGTVISYRMLTDA